MDAQIAQLLAELTVEEKASLLAGADLWYTVPIPRLGIPAFKVTDGPNGARGSEGSMAPRSACFPIGTALAATWNPALVEQVGQALGQETQAKGAHILLAPTVNLHRTPLAGRNFECYSEDPLLTARMATAYIKGVQSQGVGACIKHFVCNDAEFERRSLSSEVRERPLRELYLRPFQIAIREAQPWAVMSAYNKLNGTWCSENKRLLRDILKGEWGFDGLVMSDWIGTYTPAAACNGLDLEMPGPARWMGQHVLDALQSGRLTMEQLDDSVARILLTLQRAGVFEHPQPQPEQSIDRPEHRRLARQAAAEAIVLLKNDSVLPLDPARLRSVAVIGALARQPSIMGGGSSEVTPHYVISPLQAIQEQLGPQVAVQYSPGCAIHRNPPLLDMSWLSGAAQPGGLDIEIFAAPDFSGPPAARLFTDRANITFSDSMLAAVDPTRFSARLSATLSVPQSGAYDFQLYGSDRLRLLIDEQPAFELEEKSLLDPHHRKGERPASQVELQAGRPYALQIEYIWEGTSPWRGLRIGCLPPQPTDPLGDAAALAAQCDLAIVFAGLTAEWESEGFDRADLSLPGQQAQLIARVAAANPRTIVVLNCGSPVEMPWLDQVAGLLMAWYPGQEAGHAVADVLFGQVNPSGRLPTTFPRRLQDTPSFTNFPGENGAVLYGEGLFIGYRHYDARDIQPLFPFGFGLSYTSFAYHSLLLNKACYAPSEALHLAIELSNTGARPGHEVVQVYLRPLNPRLQRPPKELKAFTKVFLQPGERRCVELDLECAALACYDDARQAWVTEPGSYEVLVGASSRHIHLQAAFELEAGELLSDGQPARKALLSTTSPIQSLLDNPAALEVLKKHIPQALAAPELSMAMAMSLEQVAPFTQGLLNEEVLAKINEDLKKL